MNMNSICGSWSTFLLLVLYGLCGSAITRAGYVLNLAPQGSIQSEAFGIHGNTVVGYYFVAGREGPLGFTYDIASGSRLTLDMPGSTRTSPQAIYGNRIVGYAENPIDGPTSFLYTGGVYSKIQVPGSSGGNYATSVSANRIAGNYGLIGPGGVGRQAGFVFDGFNYTTVEPPNSRRTVVTGVSDSLVVGTYEKTSGPQIGFVFDGTTYTDILPVPNNVSGEHTSIFGIDGTNVVGHQNVFGGFVFNGSQFSIIDGGYVPVAIDGNSLTGVADSLNGFLFANGRYSLIDAAGNGTRPYDVYGTDVVGFYYDNNNNGVHSFLYRGGATAVPEPSSFALGLVTILSVCIFRRLPHLAKMVNFPTSR